MLIPNFFISRRFSRIVNNAPAEGVNMSNETVTVNRKYKDTVFRKLYSDMRKCMELYNALHGTNYTNVEEFEIVTLENAIYMSKKNDLAFVFDYRLSLYEHQASHNPNIPLRDLFYISAEYQKMITGTSLYTSSPIGIPAPHFVVFYNGIKDRPEREILKLSDLYSVKEEEPMLELQVLVLNINPGFNEELKEKCRTLYEYMLFVERIRSYREKNYPLNEAVIRAVDECINEDILKDFLIANKSEVIAMSIFEFDEEKEWRMFGEAEREAERKELLISLVNDKLISIAEAANRFGVSENEFKRYL